METLNLRSKLIEQFNLFIQDDTKLLNLEGFFDSLNSQDTQSIIPEEHYKIVEERRADYISGTTKSLTWEEVKQNLKNKYGF